MTYNTFGLRLAAVMIDHLLLFPLFFIGGERTDSTFVLVAITAMVVEHGYFVIGHAQYGQTVGKRLTGVKVVSAHQHQPIGWIKAIQRELLWILLSITYSFLLTEQSNPVMMIPGMVLIVFDAALAMIHPQNRSLRDFIAGTVVIRTKEVVTR